MAGLQRLDGVRRARWRDCGVTMLDPDDPFRGWTIHEVPSAIDIWATQISRLKIGNGADIPCRARWRGRSRARASRPSYAGNACGGNGFPPEPRYKKRAPAKANSCRRGLFEPFSAPCRTDHAMSAQRLIGLPGPLSSSVPLASTQLRSRLQLLTPPDKYFQIRHRRSLRALPLILPNRVDLAHGELVVARSSEDGHFGSARFGVRHSRLFRAARFVEDGLFDSTGCSSESLSLSSSDLRPGSRSNSGAWRPSPGIGFPVPTTSLASFARETVLPHILRRDGHVDFAC